jgi:hypothetical protein
MLGVSKVTTGARSKRDP